MDRKSNPKGPIRVIKRNDIAVPASVPVLNNAKASSIVRHRKTNSVNDWIAESREMIQREKAFDETRILGWNTTLPRRK